MPGQPPRCGCRRRHRHKLKVHNAVVSTGARTSPLDPFIMIRNQLRRIGATGFRVDKLLIAPEDVRRAQDLSCGATRSRQRLGKHRAPVFRRLVSSFNVTRWEPRCPHRSSHWSFGGQLPALCRNAKLPSRRNAFSSCAVKC